MIFPLGVNSAPQYVVKLTRTRRRINL